MTGRYLVDTSAWILHFSSKNPFNLSTVCPPGSRFLCLPVYQELLQGIRDDVAYRSISEILSAARFVEDPLSRQVFLEAVELYRLARKQGITVRSSVDCLIAACAIRHNLTVLHVDRDYPLIASICALKQQQIS